MAKKDNTEPKGLIVGEVGTGELPALVSPGGRRGTQYQGVLDQMGRLKAGQFITLPIANVPVKPGNKALTARDLQNRIGGAKRTHPVDAPKGHHFRMSPTADGKSLAIIVEKD